MKRYIIQLMVVALIGTTLGFALVGLGVITSDAKVQSPTSLTCRTVGYFTQLLDEPKPDQYDLEEMLCLQNGMRITKIKANNRSEVAHLNEFAKMRRHYSDHEEPGLVCVVRPGKSYILDLTYYWNPAIPSLNAKETRSYSQWAIRYKIANDCKTF